jgi:hypothetical protein
MERDHMEDLGEDGREIGCEGVDWFHLVQNRDKWQALVGTIKGREFLE